MPIYAYRCQDCGFEKDQLQKLSDPPLTQCPSCNREGFVRVLTAPAFQLKGSGWYVTDFRDQGKGGQGKAPAEGGEGASGAEKGATTPAAAATPAPASAGAASAAPAGSSSSGAAAPASSGSGSGTPAPA